MEHVTVIVRNTFIEIQQPADPSSARRASSLPRLWRIRDHADSLIGACTRLAISNADELSEATHIHTQFAVNSSISTVPTAAPTQSSDNTRKPTVTEDPTLLEMKSDNSAMRGDVLDLFLAEKQASVRAEASVTQASTKGVRTCTRSLDLKSRSRSASSDRSSCSGNSHGTGSTSCDSGDLGSGMSSSSSFFVSVDGAPSLPPPNSPVAVPEETNYVSASRRSRRRRAAARKAAEQAEQGRLRIHAPFFQPAVLPKSQQASPFSTDMFDMVSVAQTLILSCPHVLSVQIVKPDSNQTMATNIVVSYHAGKVWARDVRSLAKNAFLEAVEKSEQVFILGYGFDPFMDESDLGFASSIGCVPVDRQHAICWDFWQQGFCQRLSTCRWCHPVSSDLMNVNFVFEPALLPVQQVQFFLSGPACPVNSLGAAASSWMGCSV